jgi:hypothetical protein
MIRHLRRAVQRLEALLFNIKKTTSIKQIALRDMLKNAFKSICTSNAVVSPDLVSYSINFFTRKQRMILKKKTKEISKWNTALYSQSTGAVTKNYL